MKLTMKQKIAKQTGNYMSFDHKVLELKRSWDEIAGLIKANNKTKKK